jgi:Protein of unknown function (DUF2752)
MDETQTRNDCREVPVATVELATADGAGTARRQHHRVVLGICCFALAMSFLLQVIPEGRVAFRGFESYPLPHTCAMRIVLHRNCAGCGMTRGFIYLAHGRLRESLAVHPLAWLFFAAMLLQFPYRIAALRWDKPYPLGKRWPAVCGWSLIGLLLLTWCVRLVLDG